MKHSSQLTVFSMCNSHVGIWMLQSLNIQWLMRYKLNQWIILCKWGTDRAVCYLQWGGRGARMAWSCLVTFRPWDGVGCNVYKDRSKGPEQQIWQTAYGQGIVQTAWQTWWNSCELSRHTSNTTQICHEKWTNYLPDTRSCNHSIWKAIEAICLWRRSPQNGWTGLTYSVSSRK